MNQYILDNQIKNQYDMLPSGWTFFGLVTGKAELYSGYTTNLKARLHFLENKAREGGIYSELWNQVKNVHWLSFPTALEAMLHYKCHLQNSSPEYQYRLLPFSDYAYLGLDSARFPFISIQEHTNDDWLYVGPFRSRFFLADVLDTYARILKLPACETSNYPCAKFDTGQCRGWCLHLAPAQESASEHDLEKLDALLKEAFVHPANGILELVEQQKNAYFDELEFEKASLLEDELSLLHKYRDWLNFLYVAKDLHYDSDTLQIRQGRIAFCRYLDKDYHFPVENTQYR